jgi:hypothetical protein
MLAWLIKLAMLSPMLVFFCLSLLPFSVLAIYNNNFLEKHSAAFLVQIWLQLPFWLWLKIQVGLVGANGTAKLS